MIDYRCKNWTISKSTIRISDVVRGDDVVTRPGVVNRRRMKSCAGSPLAVCDLVSHHEKFCSNVEICHTV